MADFIVIADMGEQFDIRKEILENATKEEADNLAWELANELYSSYEGANGIYDLDDFLEEYENDRTAAEEAYEESISDWVGYYTVEITKDTPRCPACGAPLCKKESEGWCFDCDEYCGDDQMIYFTGDIHGDPSRIINAYESGKIVDNDIVIILGDAGFNYYHNHKWGFKKDEKVKQKVKDLPITILCVRGNHEKRPSHISTYKEVEAFNSIAYWEEQFPNLYFLKDGCEYELGGRKFLILGGAYSVDKWFRLENGWNWFIDEQLSEEEREEIWNKLYNSEKSLDIILSHTCPLKYEPYDKFLPTINQSLVDKSMERWLNKIEDTFNYNYWLFGHYHDDRKITDNVYMLYNSFLSLEELTS